MDAQTLTVNRLRANLPYKEILSSKGSYVFLDKSHGSPAAFLSQFLKMLSLTPLYSDNKLQMAGGNK